MKLPHSLLFLSAITTAPLGAAVVYADFNDNSLGGLGSFTVGAGQGGGSGFLGGDTWANTGTIDVIGGDLTAPGSTGYALTQSGTPQSAQGTFASGRQTTRATAITMGTAGDVWFSFLLNQASSNSRGGITLNQNASAPANFRIVAAGDEVRVGLGGTLEGVGAGTPISIGTDNLLLGQLIIDASGDETINFWLNPDVSGGIAGLPAPNSTLTENAASLDGGITRVGVQSYSSDNIGGIVDAFVLSDDADPNSAFAAVTGVSPIPEPSAGLLSLLALACSTSIRRRK